MRANVRRDTGAERLHRSDILEIDIESAKTLRLVRDSSRQTRQSNSVLETWTQADLSGVIGPLPRFPTSAPQDHALDFLSFLRFGSYATRWPL